MLKGKIPPCGRSDARLSCPLRTHLVRQSPLHWQRENLGAVSLQRNRRVRLQTQRGRGRGVQRQENPGIQIYQHPAQPRRGNHAVNLSCGRTQA